MMNEDASIWQSYGDWAKQTETVILKEYFESNGLVLEIVKKRLIELRKELDWENAGVLEKLLIRQICLTYLRLYFVERQHHQCESVVENEQKESERQFSPTMYHQRVG